MPPDPLNPLSVTASPPGAARLQYRGYDLNRLIAVLDKEIDEVSRNSEPCRRIAKIKGMGPKKATAIVAATGERWEFENGRQLTTRVGLAPRQFSTRDRTTLMGISKLGSQHFA